MSSRSAALLRPAVVVAMMALALVVPRTADANEPPLAAPRTSKVEWHPEWSRFTLWEGALTVAATAGVYVAERHLPDPDSARVNWEVPLLDPTVRFLLRGRSKNIQYGFARYSDVGFRMMAFLPYIMDDGIAALVVHRNPDVAAQLFFIDIQALTLSGATQLLLSRAVGRARPYVQDCINGATFSRECGTGSDFKSFYSGHAAGAFTSAGLICLHHQHLPLFGGGPVEAWTCTWAVSVAAFTGIARIVNDVHYASDVLFGAGVGWFYGYVMPKWLHFKNGKLVTGERSKTRASLERLMPVLMPTGDGGAQLSLSGIF
jgi:membrane-associated phospholipid phosphatase